MKVAKLWIKIKINMIPPHGFDHFGGGFTISELFQLNKN